MLVDDGLATGATMVAAVRWARAQGAARVVVAVPVGGGSDRRRCCETRPTTVVCPHEQRRFGAVGFWYDAFDQLTDGDVIALLDDGPRVSGVAGAGGRPALLGCRGSSLSDRLRARRARPPAREERRSVLTTRS